ncbi:hypothetical protein [Antarctobacter sp.]|uniref:hypothetical protein n=1 Tax=Antarctobacter sp. TaxID=1872577 RepID=UPI003A8D8E77
MKNALTLFLSLLTLMAGALVGAVAGFFLVIGLGLSFGAYAGDGGLAMGAATAGAPVGAGLGALVALIAVIRWHRLPHGKPFLSQRALAVWIGVPVAITLALVLRIWSITTPEFATPRPELLVEIRVASGAIDETKTRYRPLSPLYHRAGTYVPPYTYIETRTEGGYDFGLVRYVMVYKVEQRELALEIDRDLFAVFPLSVGRDAKATDQFTDWQSPAFFRFEESGEPPVISDPTDLDVAIRYLVHRGE